MELFKDDEFFGFEVDQHTKEYNLLDDLKLDFETEDEDLDVGDETDQTTLLD